MIRTGSTTVDGTFCRLFERGKVGVPILLIHGLGLNQEMWAAQIDALAERGPVITYDLFGHGVSPPPPETPCLGLFADQAASVLEHFGYENAVIAGFSLGGMIARRIAMTYPEMTMALVVLHSPHQRTSAEHDSIQARVHQAEKHGPAATVDAAIERWFTEDFRAKAPQVIQQVKDWVMANDPGIYPPIYQVLVDGVDELISPSPPVRCPALVMTGDEDFGNHPAMSAAIAREIEGAELVVLNGLRHMAMMEAPEIFNPPLLRFLDQLPSGKSMPPQEKTMIKGENSWN
ncbi:alpha/beta fold hydrolase [Alphaproteobacteria bacterium LSUCC0684]